MATPQISAGDSAPTPVPTVEVNNPVQTEGKQEKEKSGIKKFWPFKKKEDKSKDAAGASGGGLTSDYSGRSPRSGSPVPAAGMSAPTSPARGAGASPRVASPASSQIFERNVQEESLAPAAVPTAIPSHIATENHIPPALDASSHAITDEKLNPDTVEIFTHAAHTPAAVTVAQGTAAGSVSGVAPSGMLSEASISPTLPATSEEAAAARSPQLGQVAGAGSPASLDDGTSSYGALDSTDVRRLSFISFADVVHGEQSHSVGGGGSESGAGIAAPSSGNLGPTSVPMQPMSPALSAASPIISSPLRSSSPAPGRGTSPARAVSPSSASNAGSPKMVGASPSPPAGGVVGELAVETMSQALRKTGSGDMGAARERDRERDLVSSAEGLGLGTR